MGASSPCRRLSLAAGFPLPQAFPCRRLSLAAGFPLPQAFPCRRLSLAAGFSLRIERHPVFPDYFLKLLQPAD